MGHGVHASAPAESRYVPAGQGVHELAPASAAKEPAAHALQVVLLEAPITRLLDPAGHCEHAAAPGEAL